MTDVGQILIGQFRGGEYLPTFEEICGGSRKQYDELAEKVAAFANNEATQLPYSSMNPNALFQLFLASGANCPDKTYGKFAFSTAQKIKEAPLPSDRYEEWQIFLSQYHKLTEQLDSLIETTVNENKTLSPDKKHKILITARRAGILFKNVKEAVQHFSRLPATQIGYENYLIARELNVLEGMLQKKVGGIFNSAPTPLAQVIEKKIFNIAPVFSFLDPEEVKRIFSVAQAASSQADNNVDLQTVLKEFQTGYRNFNNPFTWAYKIYQKGINWEKFGVKLYIEQSWNIEPLYPQIVKEIISRIALIAASIGTGDKSIEIGLSWDDVSNELIISSGNILELQKNPLWKHINYLIDQMGAKSANGLFRPSIYIEIPLKKTSSPESNNPGNASTPSSGSDKIPNLPPTSSWGASTKEFVGSQNASKSRIKPYHLDSLPTNQWAGDDGSMLLVNWQTMEPVTSLY